MRSVAVLLAALAACEAAAPAIARDDDGVGGPLDAGARDARPPSGPPPEMECEPKLLPSAPVPADYAGRKNPLSSTSAELAAGSARYAQRCAICHGARGRGDGKGGPYFPPSADFSAKLRPDDYLFWRISEGGYVDPFCTAMPAFRGSFTERERWELVAHIHELAVGDAGTDGGDGG